MSPWGAGRWLLTVILMLGALAAPWRDVGASVVLTPGVTEQPLAGHWSALRDPAGRLEVGDIIRSPAVHGFTPLRGELVAGYDRAVWWLRAEIRREPGAPADWLLEVEPAYLDSISLYVEDGRGGLRSVVTGDRSAFASRDLAYRTFVFRIHLGDDLPHRVYLRVASTSSIAVSARVLTPESFIQAAGRRDVAQGLAHGVSIVIILFALVQFVAWRDRLYLGFLGYAVPVEAMYTASGGFASQYLFPDLPLVANHLLGISACLAIGGGALFTARVLDFESHYPWMGRIYRLGGRLCQLASASVPLGVYWIAAPVVQTLALASFFATAFLALRRGLAGDVVARWFLLAFAVQAVVNVPVVGRLLGLAELPVRLDLLSHFAMGAHLLLLGCGLVWRGAGLEADRLRIRQRQLESAHQIERALEERVRVRTQELAHSNATLAREIAERRAAEDRVRERERQVRAILDAAPFPMVVTGFPDGAVQYLNQPASELLNVPAEEAIGLLTASFHLDPADQAALTGRLERDGAVLGTEMRIRRMPREQRWVLLSAVRFSYRGGDCALVCLNDITTRKQLEEMLRLTGRRAEAALEAERQAMREQRNFLSMVSHEFRVPLAIIEAASQLLSIYVPGDDEASDELAKIHRAVRRMSDLIDICLADDRLDSSSLRLQTDRVDLTRMLSDVCDDKRPLAGGREIRLEAPAGAGLDADPTLLRIAFSNLIDNALKFSPPDTTVAVTASTERGAVRVRISDQGPGIAVEEQQRIFEKFYRSTKSDRVRGAGLGLYIVKRIMDLHGAAISVDSRLGMGTAFELWLPSPEARCTDSINT